MSKKVVSLILSILMVISSVPIFSVSAFALENNKEFNYSIKNDECTITKYTGTSDTVTIPTKINGIKVSGISSDAFIDSNIAEFKTEKDNNTYYSFNGVLYKRDRINEYTLAAYPNIKSDEEYYVSPMCTKIQSYAFEGTKHLKYLDCSDSIITKIGAYAFYNSSIEKISLFENKNSTLDFLEIEDYAFAKSQLKGYKFTNVSTSVGEYAFSDCKNFKSVTFPTSENHEISLNNGCFDGAPLSPIVTIASVNSISGNIFGDNDNIVEIKLNSDFYAGTDFDNFNSLINLKSFSVTDDFLINKYNKPRGGFFVKDNCLYSQSERNRTYYRTLCNYPKAKSDTEYAVYSSADTENYGVNITFAEKSFAGNKNIKNISGNNISLIDEKAFYDCSGLTNADFNDSRVTVNKTAFENSNLTNFTANTVKDYPSSYRNTPYNEKRLSNAEWIDDIQYDGKNIVNIRKNDTGKYSIKEGITYIPSEIFNNVDYVKEVTLPTTLTDIEKSAFENSTVMKLIFNGNSVINIGDNAFKGCKFDELTVNCNLNAYYSFDNCSISKLNINIDDFNTNDVFNNTNISEISYGNKVSKICSIAQRSNIVVNLAENITEIPENAFLDCDNITVNGLSSKAVIGKSAFQNAKLRGFTLENYLEIRDYAFTGATFDKVILKNAKYGANSLSGITLSDVEVEESFKDANFTINGKNNESEYITLLNNSNCNVLKFDSTTDISLPSQYLFSGLRADRITISDTVKSISEKSLQGLTANSVTIPNIESNGAFYKSNIKNITILGTVIHDNEFSYNDSLENISLPNSVSTIGKNAFIGCTNLKSVNIGSSVSVIGDYTFNGCRNANIVIDNFECQVKYNADNTFSNTNTVTFSKGPHDYSIKSETQAECEKEGKITYECKLCHETKTEKIEALKHNYIITVVQPKCNSYGYTIHICSLCGKTYKDNYVEKAEHSYSLAKSETVPIDDYKYESKTIDTYYCKICSNSYTESHLNEHNYIERNIAPTCTERGYKLHKCKCGKEYRTDYIAATGHNYKAIEKVRPSYSSAGHIFYRCTACGNTVTKTIPKLDKPVLDSPEVKNSSSTNNSITLKWKQNSKVDGYQVYSVANGKYTLIKSIKSNSVISYTISNLKCNSKYEFAMRSFKKINGKITYSDYSPVFSAKTMLGNVTITSVKKNKNKVSVKWKSKGENTKYLLQYSTNSKFNSKQTKTVEIKNGKLTANINLKKNKKYYFKICAADKSNYSKWSNTKSIKL